jgi:hypothetical protein
VKLNGREYAGLPDSFLHDLRVELGIEAGGNPPGFLPGDFEREFTQTIELIKSIRGLGFYTLAGPARVIAKYAYLRPDGSLCQMDSAVPEDVRSQLGAAQLTGDQMIDAVYAATMPQVLAAFHADWGVDP